MQKVSLKSDTMQGRNSGIFVKFILKFKGILVFPMIWKMVVRIISFKEMASIPEHREIAVAAQELEFQIEF